MRTSVSVSIYLIWFQWAVCEKEQTNKRLQVKVRDYLETMQCCNHFLFVSIISFLKQNELLSLQ